MNKYRKELDGIRALAVLAVIIYHANQSIFGFTVFKGGFFGVDIFFVLSGYLITNIISNSITSNSFNIVDFYWRRFKRIYPALILVLFISSIVAYIYLLPKELEMFAKSLKSALYFGSNYYFLQEDSYIADASIYKPLLHTWSLAVEWQFYLVFPFIAWFIFKFFNSYAFSLLFLLTIVSFFYATSNVKSQPDSAFFLLPSRAWEFFVGGLLIFFDRSKINNVLINEERKLKIFRNLVLWLGFFLLIYSFFFIDDKHLHPSYITLLPVLGVSIFILFANQEQFFTILLSWKVLVFIGVISYSLYLWHQPILVFYRFIFNEIISKKDFIYLLIISFVISWFGFVLVEKPFRMKMNLLRMLLVVISISLLALFVKFTLKTNGFPSRLSENISKAYEMYQQVEFRRLLGLSPGIGYRSNASFYECNMRRPDNACIYNDGSWVVLGDSYAGVFDYALNEKLKQKGRGIISFSYEQCPFVDDEIWFGNVPECVLVNKDRWKEILKFKDKKNFLISANFLQFDVAKKMSENPINDAQNNFSGGEVIKTDIAWYSFANNINKLLNLGHTVTIIYQPISPTEDVAKLVMKSIRNMNNEFTEIYELNEPSWHDVQQIKKKLNSYLPDRLNLYKVYPDDIFCNKNKQCRIVSVKGGVFNGGSHLSFFGVEEVLEHIPLLH